MNKILYLGALIPLLLLLAPNAYAESSQQRWNNGYNDGFNWAGSPANACHGHTHSYCDGFNVGYSRGHTSNIYYTPTQQTQSSDVNIKGSNNDVVVNQGQASNTDSGSSGSGSGGNPRCILLCGSVNVK
jgi:hypothetical protein